VTYQPDAMTHLQLSDRSWLSCTQCQSPCSEVSLCRCCRPKTELASQVKTETELVIDTEVPETPQAEVRHVSDGDVGVVGEA
jgi:hypothetical protein